MAVWSWGEPTATRAVVCVHGLSRQGRDFDLLASALIASSAEPLRVVCPDVAGRGRSDWLADPLRYQLPTYAGDMLALLAWLHAQAPLRSFDWVGTSMGGLIGMAIAGSSGLPLPAPLRRLVLNDVGPAIEWAALQRIGTYLGKDPVFGTREEAQQALWRISGGFGPHTPAQWQALCEPMLKRAAGGGFSLHYDPAIAVPFHALTEEAATQGQAGLWQLYDAITARTLLLRGEQSDLLSHDTALRMTQRGPRPRLVEFAGVGHAPTLVAADQIAAVHSFLQGD